MPLMFPYIMLGEIIILLNFIVTLTVLNKKKTKK